MEACAELFEELTAALSQKPKWSAVYKGFSSVFYKVLTFNTQFVTVKFKGTYAKVSYLLKEHNADTALTKMVNEARVRIRYCGDSDGKSLKKGELKDNYLRDYEALCRLIAIVYGCEIPKEATAKFPLTTKDLAAGDEGKSVFRLFDGGECLRLIVDSWDDDYVYGAIDGLEGQQKVSYSHSLYDNLDCCWSYLKDFLFSGSLLNLIRSQEKDGVLFPELIIFEPDYLINISEIAACFQPQAVSHLNHLIRKLQPSQHSEPILLGNFAGQLLDEEIHREYEENNSKHKENNSEQSVSDAKAEQQAYFDSVMKFFKSSAFSLLATETSQNFHREAQSQKANIRRSFAELPTVVHNYDREKVILEPSFFSQMLGLQGRVDLMQQDFRFLVEQKSGKSRFPCPANPTDSPQPTEAHYVQILLYMMIMRYNFREIYERNNRQLQCFLLYSRYATSLCGVDFAPKMMFEAIRVRNAIAWSDDRYAKEGFHILDELTPESFRQRAVSDKLWDIYLRPQLAQILDPIHNATELERKYFHRMMTFVANEHLLAKVGSNQREDSGQASIWLSSVEEKQQSGNIFTDLQLVSPTKDHQGAVESVVLSFKERKDNSMCNFRKGDIVILYPYEKQEVPDACHKIITRCTITELTADSLTLRLRAPQSSARLFTETTEIVWAVEHDFMESSYSSLYRGLHAFLNAPKERRDLLLLQRYPEYDDTKTLSGDYGNFNRLSLRVKQAKDLFLIIGPPGTGKTSYGMLNTLKEELTNEGSSVLITSYTNRAVDEICSKLAAEGIDFIRLGSGISADEAYKNNLIDSKINDCQNINALKESIRNTRVIVGTTTSVSSNPALFLLKGFDLLIVDEASQILEPHLLPILSAMHDGEPAIRKMVMIGDHKQLPAVVKQQIEESKVTDPQLNAINLTDCRLSLFERLLGKYGNDEHITYMLTKQGRMHRDIAQFPNEAFYGGKLQVVPLPHQTADLKPLLKKGSVIDNILTRCRIAFLSVNPPSQKQWINDKINQAEAKVIARMVYHIYRKNTAASGKNKVSSDDNSASFDVNNTVGVIVPYRNQIATVRNAIAKYGVEQLQDITIDTVERYQGSQRDYIIYGFTVQKHYQLQFLTNNTFVEDGAVIDRKLNVAMTRARKHLVMVGNAQLLASDIVFAKLLDFVKKRNGFFDNERSS